MPKGIVIKADGYKVLYRDAKEIRFENNILTFKTSVTCLGNAVTKDGFRCKRRFNPDTISGIEQIDPNPIQILYRPVSKEYRTTQVIVYMKHFKGFKEKDFA